MTTTAHTDRQVMISAAMERGRQARSDAMRDGWRGARDILRRWQTGAVAALRA